MTSMRDGALRAQPWMGALSLCMALGFGLLSGCVGAPADGESAGDDDIAGTAAEEEDVGEAAGAIVGGGLCSEAHYSGGCADDSIEACVCAADSYCCNNQWDGLCVSEVNSLGCQRCDVAHPTPGCNDSAVKACVCAADPYCCNNQWDSTCVWEVTSLSCQPLADKVIGKLTCAAVDSAAPIVNNLGQVKIQIPGFPAATTKNDGTFEIPAPYHGGQVHLDIVYDAQIKTGSSPEIATRLQVMDDLHNTRSDGIDRGGDLRTGRKLDLGEVKLSTPDCEIWRLGALALDDYHKVRKASPPAGQLRIKRFSGVYVGTPHAFYDYIVLRTDFTTSGFYIKKDQREATIFHELGHTVRHVADGSQSHWDGDNFKWIYARTHDGSEITNVQFAFNEGWGNYWALARSWNHGYFCTFGAADCDTPPDGNRDWNESLVANRLIDLSAMVAATLPAGADVRDRADRIMVEVLEQNPGTIHSLSDFEQKLALRVPGLGPFAAPASCPPGFVDDGLTCRRDVSSIAKASYGRGVGTAPNQCGAQEYDAGLCYPYCAPGFDGVGPVCWQLCPYGYADDGLTCRRDASIIGADNSACPWYDACGLTFSKGCSKCPAGYANDGCTCRIDAHIFGKSSYGRGAGSVPTQCGAGLEYDAGLCYLQCAPGYDGVGPVCWKEGCPDGYQDQGAVCYRDALVITKY